MPIQIFGGLTVIRHSGIFLFICNSDNLEEKCPSWNNMIEVDGNMYILRFFLLIILYYVYIACSHQLFESMGPDPTASNQKKT